MPVDWRHAVPRFHLRLGVIACAVILCVAPAEAGRVTGTVELSSGRDGQLQEVVVYFEPRIPAKLTVPREPLIMETKGKKFVPRVLVVPKGARVRFPNADPILHNVFSVSGRNRFDLGLYRTGKGKSWRFDSAGVARIFCNVHQSMVGYVKVLDTPFFTTPDGAGRFVLNVPSGQAGTLHVWHWRAKSWAMELPGGDSSIKATLEVTRKRIPPHRNKHGRAYRRGRRY